MKEIKLLSDSFDLQGNWWIPGREEVKIYGTLKYSAGHTITLELVGTFLGHDDPNPDRILDLIYGITTDGNEVSLCDCTRWTLSSSLDNIVAINRCIYIAEYLLVGYHFISRNKVLTGYLSCELAHLTSWIPLFPIKHDSKGNNVSQITVTWGKPQKLLEYDLFSISLKAAHTLNYTSNNSASTERKIHLAINSETEVPIEKFLSLLRRLGQFFSLILNQAVYPLNLFCTNNQNTFGNDDEYQPPIYIYYRLQQPEEHRSDFLNEFYFTFNQIESYLPNMLRAWLENTPLLEMIWDLYFSTLYFSNIFLENKFLNIVSSVEAFHRRTSSINASENEEHENRLKSIMASAPMEYSSWLKQKLKYSNEPTLRKRLKELISQCPEEIQYLSESYGDFIGDVVTNRNYLTHYDESLKTQKKGGTELLLLSKILAIMFEALLLKKLGVDEKILSLALRRCLKFQNIRHKIKKR